MLSDEEKENLIKKLRYCEQEYEQNGYLSVGKFKAIKQAANLIEKQSKEIEELKDFNTKLQATKDRLDGYDKENTLEIEKLKKEIEELKTEKAKRSWVHIKENGEVEPLFYVSKEKIKAKIKALDETRQYWTEEVKAVLQSLLEKE